MISISQVEHSVLTNMRLFRKENYVPFFKNNIFGGHFVGPLIPLFWTSGDVFSGSELTLRL